MIFVAVGTSLRDPVLLAALALCLASRLGLRFLLARLGLVFCGSALFLVLTVVSQPGNPEALVPAGLACLRLLAAAAAVIWLAGTLGERNLFAALYSLGLPPLLIYQLLLTWRYFRVPAADVLSLWRATGRGALRPAAVSGAAIPSRR